MTIGQVKNYFKNMEAVSCPLTEQLVMAGYQQANTGYIARAINEGIEVDYKQNKPSQYWHLMSYCNSHDADKQFGKNIVCGELIFWMAEVSGCVPKSDLQNLVKRIIRSGSQDKDGKPHFTRMKWNKEIQNLCFDRIEATVKKRQKYNSDSHLGNGKKQITVFAKDWVTSC